MEGTVLILIVSNCAMKLVHEYEKSVLNGNRVDKRREPIYWLDNEKLVQFNYSCVPILISVQFGDSKDCIMCIHFYFHLRL